MNKPAISPLMQTRPAQALEWFLVIETGSLAGQRFPLLSPGSRLMMGREADCAVRFDPQRERVVGRHHAYLEARSDGVYLVDNHSANGTFQNGAAIKEVRVQHGDRFQLGGEIDGVEGPWITIQMPVASHVGPVHMEPATLITRPASSNERTIPPGPPISLGKTLPPNQLPLAAPPPEPEPLPVKPSLSETGRSLADSSSAYSPSRPEPAIESRRAAVEAAVLDREHSQRRTQLVRQIGLIALLLIVACALGVTFGLRDTDSATQSESEVPQ